MPSKGHWLISFAALTGLIACGGSGAKSGGASDGGASDGGSAGGGATGGLTASQFCSQLTGALATRLGDCLLGPASFWTATFQGQCSAVATSVSSGRVKYDASQAQACLGEIAGMSCAVISSGSGALAEQSCAAALVGTVPTGGSCYDTGLDCVPNDICDLTSCPGICRAELAAGQACAAGDICVTGYSCVNSVCTQQASPSPGASQGQGCNAQSGPFCAVGLNCDPVSNLCEPVVAEGGGCVPAHDQCEMGTYCGGSNVCTVYSSAGGPCGLTPTGEYAGCFPGAYCNAQSQMGSCVAALAAGAACSQGMECQSGSCTNASCVPACSGA